MRQPNPDMKRDIRFDPAFFPSEDVLTRLGDFVALVWHLRRDCPWDREQTHSSVKHLMIEEAYEALEAIEEADAVSLSKELGDVLLHVVFHSVMAEQAGTFTLAQVVEQEIEKLVRRHPHVFDDVTVGDTREVLQNWEKIKAKEGPRSLLSGVPKSLPALLRAHRIQEKVAGVGFDFADARTAWTKVKEELREVEAELEAGTSRAEDEFGDLLFALVNAGRLMGFSPEDALQRTNQKFTARFSEVETRLAREGNPVGQASLEEMDAVWEAIKQEQRA